MFDGSRIEDLDADAACEAICATQEALREHEWHELVLAARWAVLHDGADLSAKRRPDRPGAERARPAGAHGTPTVAEFACAELGLLMGIGPVAASNLIRDAANLQHRHPLLWAALADGKGRVWKARKVAQLCQAAGLSREQAWFVDTTTTEHIDSMTWSAFARLVEARIIDADPRAAEERREQAAQERFVAVGQSDEYGLKTLIARANAGHVIAFMAVCDRIAAILELEGDTDPVGVRRSKALAVIANPARYAALLVKYSTDQPHPSDPDPDPDHHPVGDLAALAALEPDRLRPRAVLHVRISEAVLGGRGGVAYVEDQGGMVLPAGALRDLLGHHHVTVRGVLDQRDQVPVDAYEVPVRMREALRLARFSSVFPWSRTGTHHPDVDHSKPYVPPDRGGPPGQTRIGNLGPMHRFGHRVKTHGRGWVHRQPRPGVYLWRTPHGYWFRVDNDGTHPLGRDPDLREYQPAPSDSPLERALAELLRC